MSTEWKGCSTEDENKSSDRYQAERKQCYAGIAQLVEHNLAKVGVASSNLVSRSNPPPMFCNLSATFFTLLVCRIVISASFVSFAMLLTGRVPPLVSWPP